LVHRSHHGDALDDWIARHCSQARHRPLTLDVPRTATLGPYKQWLLAHWGDYTRRDRAQGQAPDCSGGSSVTVQPGGIVRVQLTPPHARLLHAASTAISSARARLEPQPHHAITTLAHSHSRTQQPPPHTPHQGHSTRHTHGGCSVARPLCPRTPVQCGEARARGGPTPCAADSCIWLVIV
jgi:hypothetical protein